MDTWLSRGWRGRPLVAGRPWRRRDQRGRGPGPVVILPPVTLASQPFALAFPVPAIRGPTDGQIRAPRPCRLSSCYCPRGPWARRPHEQSLPLAESPGGCRATRLGSPGVLEADAGQHAAAPTPVLRARSPARGGQSGQQQGHAKVRPRVLPTKPLRRSGQYLLPPLKV